MSRDLSDQRKHQHLELAKKAQVGAGKSLLPAHFYYEPMLGHHPDADDSQEAFFPFVGQQLKLPFWISSMTGGTGEARHINKNLAQAAGEFGLGLGLGSCRSLLESDHYLPDFLLKDKVGPYPFYANLGIAQLESLLLNGELARVREVLEKLNADGLIIHVNPLQEWFQPEGDRVSKAPIETIEKALSSRELSDVSLIVKEVGQGMGPQSLWALMKLPLRAIEFASFGGTNFSLLEQLRDNDLKEQKKFDQFKTTKMAFGQIGHSADQMVEYVCQGLERFADIECRDFIISGGISSVLEGFFLREKLMATKKCRAVIGQAKNFLERATGDYQDLKNYCQQVQEAYFFASQFLRYQTERSNP